MGIEALKRLIIERTEGNPFFMEEMVQTLFEQGVLVRDGAVKLAKPLDAIRVPPTVQAILTARIDRLPGADKELLQTLAVLGREFSLSLIKRVAVKSDDELERILSNLQLGEFIYEQPAIPDIEYQFKHALTQEVAYNSVLIERRRQLHERAAQAIEALYADRLEDHLPELAHHYDRGGNARKAVEYLGWAGKRSARQGAQSEAINYLNRTVELLEQLPDDSDRVRKELDLQMALAWSLTAARGGSSPEREALLLRARELCEQAGDNGRLMEVLLALAFLHSMRRDAPKGLELAKRVLALAEREQAEPMVRGAHFQLGITFYTAGRFQEAREHFERAPGFFGVAGSGASWLSSALCLLGHPAAALTKAVEAVADAREQGGAFSLAMALFHQALIHSLLRDYRTTLERADELFALANSHELAVHQAQGRFFRSWALAVSAQSEDSIIDITRTLSIAQASASTWGLARLAEAYGRYGRLEEGLATVANGLALAERTGERIGEAELHRFQGELLLMRDPSSEAEAECCFRTAIDVARRQKAKWWELRATTSLARLLGRQQGRIDEARGMRGGIYGWFTEGLDTADLKDAKALLDELVG